jgi:hypothetical protein
MLCGRRLRDFSHHQGCAKRPKAAAPLNKMFKAVLVAVSLLSTACTQILPTPNDFPSPPETAYCGSTCSA